MFEVVLSIKINMAQFRDGIRQKVVQIQEATRPAAQAGAQVLYDAARMNARTQVMTSLKAHWFYGTNQKYLFQPETLIKSIYQVHSKRNSSAGRETYHVSYNMTKCPYAHMVEFGHKIVVKKKGVLVDTGKRALAHSFIGKALHEQSEAAYQAMKQEFTDRMNK